MWKLKLKSVVDVGFVHSSSDGKNVKDPRDREECNKENRNMAATLHKFREGKVNIFNISNSIF